MTWSSEWCEKINKSYFYEKVLVGSFAFIFIVLSCDCWFSNLPLSGYGIIFLTLLVACLTSLGFCHGFKYISSPKGPFTFSKDGSWMAQKIYKKEKEILDRLFGIEISSLAYPTSLNEQMRLLLKDIEKDFVKPWYAEVSPNPSFLFECHLVLEEILFKILAKLKVFNFRLLVQHCLSLCISHIQEYKRSLRRAGNCDYEVNRMFRYSHPGSTDDRSLNHYLSKVMEILIKEYAPHDLVCSLESSIVTRILARKMLKTLLVNLEDPAWIYIKILYLADQKRYEDITKGYSYNVKELTEPEPAVETHKFRVKPVILTHKSELEDNIFNRTLGSKAFLGSNSVCSDKKSLNLPLPTARPEPNITSVLGNLISSTAAPLLPDNASLCYQPLNKMWLSPVTELKQEITDSVVNPLLKTITEGLKMDELKGNGLKERFLLTRSKVLTRSKSSDAMNQGEEELNPPLTQRDISVGEELGGEEVGRRLVKTHSFDAGSTGDLHEGGDVSPVYEEPEDFATTIAKLRNVLQQRESSSTLSDKSNLSTDSQDLLLKESTTNSRLSLDEVSAVESQIACDVPSDGRPFVNVSIPSTEIKESSSTAYVLYTIQYDGIYLKQSDGDSSQLVLQTTIVKRRFQEFLHLQTRLEENAALRPYLRGIKGPTKWLSLPFGTKTDEKTTASRRPVLERYLQQLCERLEIASSPAMQEFLAYGSNVPTSFSSTDSNSSIQKIDKFLSNKVTGVFNSIKTVLPSFETNIPVLDAKEVKECKPTVEQNLLQGFLGFGNKPEDLPSINFSFIISEASGEALTDDIRHYLSEKSDCIEDALDVLDSSEWHSETGECHVLTSKAQCVWSTFKEAIIDDDVDKFDGEVPIVQLVLDILSELLEDLDSWLTKEPVLRLLKVMLTQIEKQCEEKLSAVDWDRVCANLLRLLRAALFLHQSAGALQLEVADVQVALFDAILELIPDAFIRLLGEATVRSAILQLLKCLQHSRCNRDSILKMCDLLMCQLLSCPHLKLQI